MRVAALIVAQALVAAEACAQAPYFPDVYLAPQYVAPTDAPPRVVVAGADEPGERLVVSGRVRDGGRNDAELDPRLRGAMRSDADGAYEFETIRPGHYDNNAAHVQYLVRAPGYHPLLLDLWFDDDPVLRARREAGTPEIPPSFPQNVVAIRPVTRDAAGVWRTTRDIELVRE